MFLIVNLNEVNFSIIKITKCQFIVAFSQPFRVGVHFDSDETPFFAFAAGTIITEGATADLIPSNEEFGEAPGGIIGSELISSNYWFVHIIFISIINQSYFAFLQYIFLGFSLCYDAGTPAAG